MSDVPDGPKGGHDAATNVPFHPTHHLTVGSTADGLSPKRTLDAYTAILHTHWRSGFRTGLVIGWVSALSASLLWAWLA